MKYFVCIHDYWLHIGYHIHFPSFWTDHCCWQRGHLLFCLIHNDIQHWWKEWLHSPHTTTQSFPPRASTFVVSDWHLRQASITWTLQIAQVSHSTSQLHIATAFHFFNVNMRPVSLLSASPVFSPSSIFSILAAQSSILRSSSWTHYIFTYLLVKWIKQL